MNVFALGASVLGRSLRKAAQTSDAAQTYIGLGLRGIGGLCGTSLSLYQGVDSLIAMQIEDHLTWRTTSHVRA